LSTLTPSTGAPGSVGNPVNGETGGGLGGAAGSGTFRVSWPLVAGAAWDATRVPAAAFLTLAAIGLLVTGLAASLGLRQARD